MSLALGLLIPFMGTTLGAAMVFLMKNEINSKVEKLLLGFASGIMMSASIWSLLMPAIEMSQQLGIPKWLPASVGFLCGVVFMLMLNFLTPRLNLIGKKAEFDGQKAKKTTMMMLAVTIHNVPEGMAVGVILAGAFFQNIGVSVASAMALCIGIAIQNFPEGAIISMPLKAQGVKKGKAFLYGALSGIVEPVAGIITVFLVDVMSAILPYVLSFAGGAMIYVVVEELIPESQSGENANLGTIGLAFGFLLMMLLDLMLG